MNDSKKSDLRQDTQWEHGWNEHEQMQLQRLADLAFADKLAWLDQAHRLVMQLRAAPERPSEHPSSSK